MAQQRGTFTLDIHGQTYTLVLNTAAMVRLEEHFSTPEKEVTVVEIWQRVMKGSVRANVALLWAMLHEHHPEVTLAQCARLNDGIDVQVLQQQAAEAMTPDPDDAKALGVDRPPKAQARKRGARGGDVFTSMHATPA